MKFHLQSISVSNGAHQFFTAAIWGWFPLSEPGLTWHGHQRGTHGLRTIVLLQRGREQIPLAAVVAQLSWKCS